MSITPPCSYPPSPPCDHVDEYHGTAVADPYRWLEDPDRPETQAWIAAQNQVTQAYIQGIPQRQALADRLTDLWNFERYGIPFCQTLPGGKNLYFYFKNDGLQNQSVLYVQEGLEGEPRLLLDPNTLASDGTVALGSVEVSKNGEFLAYSLASSGSDWQEWRVRVIATGEDLPDRLQWSKFSGATWSLDHQGFYYGRYDAPEPGSELESVNYYQKLYYHRLGTAQEDDRKVYDRPDQKEWGFGSQVSDDGRYLIISVWKGTDSRNLLFYQDLTQPAAPVVELISEFEASFSWIGSEGDLFWLMTDWQAPKGRLMAVNLGQPQPEHWREVIPEAAETLTQVGLVGDQLIAVYLKDAASQVRRFDLQGHALGDVVLPGLGSVAGFEGDRTQGETFYSFTSFTVPTSIYRYDLATGTSHLFRQPQVNFNSDAYETHQVFFPSADGTLIPLFLVHKKGLSLDGNHPTYLYGYGGFNVSLTPSFQVKTAVWLELGGVYAMANLRGGGEYGESWHQAGMKHQKQKVFEDFIAAAEWLVAQGYTCPQKLAIAGGSNGGLLVGACMTQRPDLFGAALPAVGVMDMLRFHKFTIGWAWCSEYGSPDDPEDFPVLYAYSPLHNLRSGTAYPATLIATGDHDDRVVPAHSFKFAAALQKAQGGDAPVLIRIETKAGHGAGKPITKAIEEVADHWAFLVKVLAMEAPTLSVP